MLIWDWRRRKNCIDKQLVSVADGTMEIANNGQFSQRHSLKRNRIQRLRSNVFFYPRDGSLVVVSRCRTAVAIYFFFLFSFLGRQAILILFRSLLFLSPSLARSLYLYLSLYMYISVLTPNYSVQEQTRTLSHCQLERYKHDLLVTGRAPLDARLGIFSVGLELTTGNRQATGACT